MASEGTISPDQIRDDADLTLATNNITASIVKGLHKAFDGTAPVADGTYTVGKGTATDGTLTIKDGIITAITEATNS